MAAQRDNTGSKKKGPVQGPGRFTPVSGTTMQGPGRYAPVGMSQVAPQQDGSTTYDLNSNSWVTRPVEGFTEEERSRFGVGAGALDPRTASAILKERRGVRLAGSSAVSQADIDKAERDAYENALRELSGAGAGGAGGYANIVSALKKLGAAQAGTINKSMSDLSAFLGGQKNPYADLVAQRTQATPEMAALLQSQGVDTGPLQQYATAINAANTGQADTYTNLINQMRAIQDATRTGMVGDVEQQRADLLNALSGNVLSSGINLMGKKANVSSNNIRALLAALGARR